MRKISSALTASSGKPRAPKSITAPSSRSNVDCEVEIEAERAEEIPKVFTKIHAHFIVSGKKLNAERVARAVELSADKYCSASRMLEKTALVTHDFEVVEVD